MLRLTDLHKRYGPVAALDGCTFELGRGQLLGFLGPDGAGILLTIGYFVSFTAIEEPNPLVRIVSFLPPLSPITMQLRMVHGDAAVWEVVLALVLAIVMI